MKPCPTLTLLFATSSLLGHAGPPTASQMDDTIEASVRNSYVFRTHLTADPIHARSSNAVVTLTGIVAADLHRSLARDTVGVLPWVKDVDNQLKVREDASTEPVDLQVGSRIRSVLLFHRSVNARATEVSVSDGRVTLRGAATSSAQKELTAEYANDIEGVKAVVNEMTIAAGPVPDLSASPAIEEVDDASVTAQVKSALRLHRSTSALRSRVQTSDGVVTVSGITRSNGERGQVTRLLSDIHGVNRVVNNMTVEPN